MRTSLTADASLRSGVNVTFVSAVGAAVKVAVSFDMDRQQYLDVASGVATMKSVFGTGSAFVVTLKAAAAAVPNADFVAFTAVDPVYSTPTTTIVNLLVPSAAPTVSFAPSAVPTVTPSIAPSARPTLTPTTATPSFQPTFKTGKCAILSCN
jgi:hypothetical protein